MHNKNCLIFLVISTFVQLVTLENVTTTSTPQIQKITEVNFKTNKLIDPGIENSTTTVTPTTVVSSTLITHSEIDSHNSTTVIAINSPSTTLVTESSPIVTRPPVNDSQYSPTVSPASVQLDSALPSIPTWPETCSERNLQTVQPIQDDLSMIRKCCPVGESLSGANASQPMDCIESSLDFNVTPIAITLYQQCIEDNETNVEMDIIVGNTCNRSVYYSESQDDQMYVIQNGSLLIMDESGAIGFRIYDDYCIDNNLRTGKLDAIVCVSPPIERHINTSQTIIYTTLMLCSIPCLFFVTFIHFAIDKLNHLHGLCIGSMSFCLGIGFLLHSISQLSTIVEIKLQYAVQYFILAYYMWILVLCFNMVIFLWFYVLRYVTLRTAHKTAHFTACVFVAMILPIFLVVYTKIKRIPGMPSYFQQGWSESIKSSQRCFIPPVSTVLALCFILLVIAFFGFRKLDKVLSARENISYHLVENGNHRQESTLPKIDRAFAEQVQLNARCLALLYIIVCMTWIFEVVTFYTPGAGEYLGFLEVMNALQGVFILIIFVFIRKKRDVIASWWHDRGSHNISDGTEMQILNRKTKPEISINKNDDVEK